MILVVGRGFVGSAIAQYLESKGIDYAVCRRTHDMELGVVRAQGVINAAGYTGKPNVDACEKDREHCLEENVNLPLKIAELCKRFHRPMVHISSGCIYWGNKNYTEEDTPNFDKSFYSLSKIMGETVLRDYDVRIARIRMPFLDGKHERCVLTKLSKYDTWLSGFNSLTYLPDVARAAVALLEAPQGIYNVTNPGIVSNQQLADYMGKKPAWYDFETFYMEGHTPRSFCTLDSTKVQQYVKLRNVHDILSEIYAKEYA